MQHLPDKDYHLPDNDYGQGAKAELDSTKKQHKLKTSKFLNKYQTIILPPEKIENCGHCERVAERNKDFFFSGVTSR